MSKYVILTDETRQIGDLTLFRIRALKDFGEVKKGELGGWVEKEGNLSQEGNCWISNDAVVCENAKVYDNARVSGNAKVSGNAMVYRYAMVSGNARVYEDARVSGNARVYEDARVSGNARVYENSQIYDHSMVSGNAVVHGNVIISGNVHLQGYMIVHGDLNLSNNKDFLIVGPIGSRNGYTVFSNNGDAESDIYVCCGCFYGTIEEFENAVRKHHEGNKFGKQYLTTIDYVKSFFTN